jgi:hypothetical protein
MINADGDLLLHLNLGRYIINAQKIPLRDIFSHTLIGQPVTQHEWLSAVIFEGVMRLFGLEGIVFLCALIISITIKLIYGYLQKKYQTLLPVILVTLLVLLNTMIHWLARPHIFTFLMLTLWLIALDQLITGNLRKWWIMPLVMLFWVNLHGGFIIGFITWLIFGFGIAWDQVFNRAGSCDKLPTLFWKYFFLGGSTSFFISLLNPSGIKLWSKVITHAGNKYLTDITNEFQSPDFHNGAFIPFLFTIVLLIFVLGSTKRKFSAEMLFNTSAWLMMSLYSLRNIPLFGIVAAPILTVGLNEMLFTENNEIKLINWLNGANRRLLKLESGLHGNYLPIFCILIVILGQSFGVKFDIDGQGYALDPEVFPVAAVDWLKENPQDGEMFNYFTWGGYLEYRLWPVERVFIDSKSDFYGEDFVRQYMRVILLEEGWEEVLDQYDVSWAILPTDERAANAIQSELGWAAIYQDDTTVILKKP